MLFKKCIKEASFIKGIMTGLTAYVTADKNCVVSDYLNVIPADFYVIISAKQTEAFPFTPDYNRHNTARAGVNFNIAHTAEPTAGFCIDNFLVS